jgi:hypothetical protein
MNTENGRLLEKQVLPEDLIVDMRLPTPRMGVKTLGGTLVVAWRWDKHTGYHGGPAPFDSRRGAIAIPGWHANRASGHRTMLHFVACAPRRTGCRLSIMGPACKEQAKTPPRFELTPAAFLGSDYGSTC